MIDTTDALHMALDDWGEEIIVGEVPCRALISTVAESDQLGMINDYTLVAEILADEIMHPGIRVKVTRADGTIWRVTNRPRVEHGSWILQLSEEMIRV